MIKRKVLLICPAFFNYESRIKNALVAQGYEVTLWSDRISTHFIYKIFLRISPYATSLISEYFFNNKLKKIKSCTYENIIVIKGEALTVNFIKKLLSTISHESNYYYLWDSVKNTNHAKLKAQLFKHIGTFDQIDAKLNNWNYRPLFASDTSIATLKSEPSQWDLCFAGTVHSDRLQVIAKIKRNVASNIKLFCFAYVPSKWMLRVKKVVYATYRQFDQTQLSITPLPYQQILSVFNNSKAIIDIEHPGQNGLTMRSIEVLLADKKLITTNKAILDTDLYHPSRVLVIDRSHPIITADFLDTEYISVQTNKKELYSIQNFVLHLCQ